MPKSKSIFVKGIVKKRGSGTYGDYVIIETPDNRSCLFSDKHVKEVNGGLWIDRVAFARKADAWTSWDGTAKTPCDAPPYEEIDEQTATTPAPTTPPAPAPAPAPVPAQPKSPPAAKKTEDGFSLPAGATVRLIGGTFEATVGKDDVTAIVIYGTRVTIQYASKKVLRFLNAPLMIEYQENAP